MSIAPLPAPLQHLGGRRFSFYPPIRNLEPHLEHNEWLYRRATWSECVVVNALSGEEMWIPRIFLGEISRMDEPVMIVRLNRELEWRAGVVVPRQRRVIEMPVAVNNVVNNVVNNAASYAVSDAFDDDGRGAPRSRHPAPVINIRLEPKSEARAWKWIGVAAVLGAVACTIVADVARQAESHQRADLFRGYRSWLQLGPDDDYASTVRKLGLPAKSGSIKPLSSQAGDRVFRVLAYPARRYSVILMGSAGPMSSANDEPRYIGTLDQRGRVIDAVRLRDGSSTESLLNSSGLRSLPSF